MPKKMPKNQENPPIVAHNELKINGQEYKLLKGNT